MNRRNFILGLGTAATLSGAASVTSAALQGSVSPGADFRVISAQQLEVRRNGALDSNGDDEVDNNTAGYVNSSDSFVDEEGNITFTSGSDVYDVEGPNMTVDNETNGGLNMSLATPNTNDTAENRNTSFGGNEIYTNADGVALLEVENLGSSTAEFAVNYGYGSQAGGSPIDDSTVAQLFTFDVAEDDDNDTDIQVSPTSGSPNTEGNSATIDPGSTIDVGFVINYSDSIEATLRNELDSGFGAVEDDLDLLNTVEFGVVST